VFSSVTHKIGLFSPKIEAITVASPTRSCVVIVADIVVPGASSSSSSFALSPLHSRLSASSRRRWRYGIKGGHGPPLVRAGTSPTQRHALVQKEEEEEEHRRSIEWGRPAVVTMGLEMTTGEMLGYSTETTESGRRGYVKHCQPAATGGQGGSSARKNDDGHCTVAECIVRLREQDFLVDDVRPRVIFAPQDEGYDRKMHRDWRGQDDADCLGSYGGGGVDRIGWDRRQGELGTRRRPLLLRRR